MAAVGDKTTVRVYAIGGDGVVFCCLNGIAGLLNVELAMVPSGTGSDFVQSFGGKELIPEMRNIEEQIKAPIIPTDIINCGNSYSLNSCAVGLEPMPLLNAYLALKRFWKFRRRSVALTKTIFRIAGMAAMLDRETMGQRYQVRIDDEEIDGPLSIIFTANSPGYPINKTVIPEAVPDDGLLDILIYRTSPLAKVLRLMPPYFGGRHGKFPDDYIYRWTRSVSVNSVQPLLSAWTGKFFSTPLLLSRFFPRWSGSLPWGAGPL